ncbi:unnamed protein product [Plutella xylostella]|uniref:Protein aurora borealis n=1 Tax=Plutella xylostella TaxID=51655 RepID=A0A8S4EML0_PLUXY|nr:unnamed protein product [Plutella xylostella]
MTDESPKSNFKSTPPTNRKVRNPFDKVLIGKLHQPICSPGMCKIYKKQSNGLFRWDIDQACTLVPADIVPCNSQFEPSPDPALERIAEEATERFFSQESVMPSPIVSSKKVKPLQISYEASTSVHITSIVKEPVETRDAQTILTMPPELPPELAKVLQKYCTFTQEQNISGDYEITANGSLRRKLQFEWHSDAEHCDSELTDEEAPKPSYEPHAPVVFSPDLKILSGFCVFLFCCFCRFLMKKWDGSLPGRWNRNRVWFSPLSHLFYIFSSFSGIQNIK